MSSALFSVLGSAHIKTVAEWRGMTRVYKVRTAEGAAKAHAKIHGAAVVLRGDDTVTHYLLDHESGVLRRQDNGPDV